MKTDNLEIFGLDTNILIFADDPSSPHHAASKEILEKVLNGSLRACVSPQILAEYFSVITSSRRVQKPLSAQDARLRVAFLSRTHRVKKIYPKRSTLRRAVEFCAEQNIKGARIFDALYAITLLDNQIHALITHNTKDFQLFKEIKLTNPFRVQTQ